MAAKQVVLISGGVDSLIVADMHQDATLLFFDYGQPYFFDELAAVNALFDNRPVIIVEIECPGLDAEDPFIPARNLSLCSLAVRYGDEILIGGVKDDNCEDKTEAALVAMSRILSDQSRKTVTVSAPLIGLNKADAIAAYLDVDDGRIKRVARLTKAFSCYNPQDGEPCCDCPACLRMACAFCANSIPAHGIECGVLSRYLEELHTYSRHRRWTILNLAKKQGRVVEYDIDGTLTNESDGIDYAARTPCKKLVTICNLDYEDGCWIVLNTARREIDRDVTAQWLHKNGVKYHALLMEKEPASKRYDDIAVQLGNR